MRRAPLALQSPHTSWFPCCESCETWASAHLRRLYAEGLRGDDAVEDEIPPTLAAALQEMAE
jgi:hypothetical protein